MDRQDTFRDREFMDASTSTAGKRRPVRDFSRRNFVLLFLLLLMIPTLYLFWYLASISSGSIVPSTDLGLPQAGAEPGGQMAYYWRVLQTAWRATVNLLPYSIGQYLLGMKCDLDQFFLWASGSLLAIGILTLVQVFDVFLNPELQGGGKFGWFIFMAAFSVIGVPVPHLIYWFQYMWTEADRSATTPPDSTTPPDTDMTPPDNTEESLPASPA
jgi:hypothetical protein